MQKLIRGSFSLLRRRCCCITAGIALIVGMQIGSGIFSSPGVVAKETGAVASALLCWLGAGLLSWAGASSFAELGSALPLNGGAQAYLDAAFGPLPAYCFSFTAVTALKPGSQAIISIIFGEYMCRLMYHTAFSADPSVAARYVRSCFSCARAHLQTSQRRPRARNQGDRCSSSVSDIRHASVELESRHKSSACSHNFQSTFLVKATLMYLMR